MPKEIGSPAPAAIPVALLVALAVILAAAPAQAAADCVPAPGLQAPRQSLLLSHGSCDGAQVLVCKFGRPKGSWPSRSKPDDSRPAA